jgi:branched-chain amino acid aminotransferase
VLRGITRDTIISLVKDQGLEFRRNDFSREELYSSDEVFLTGTAAGVTAVREIDGREIGTGAWPKTERLRGAYLDLVHGKIPKYDHWLSRVKTERLAIKQRSR